MTVLIMVSIQDSTNKFILLYIGMSKEAKDKIIRQVYYDSDSGFGSIKVHTMTHTRY